jgi:4,5-DOPA dioxygenase extradiol
VTLPTAFFGHGSPLNTLADNRYSAAWRAYAATLPVPRAILAISAHWYVPGTRVSAGPRPPTIHDFNSNFPRALFEFTYPAPGDAELAGRVSELLRPVRVERDDARWGFDHGAYCILAHLFPQAQIPVVELSIDRTKPPGFHYDLASRLAPLRDEGVFIMSSGNVVHNLELADGAAGPEPYDWARRFDDVVRRMLAERDHDSLVNYHRLGTDARLAVPTPDHYIPLLYALALQRPGERVSTIVDGFEFRAGSMLSISFAA